jgi:hypothetical protein
MTYSQMKDNGRSFVLKCYPSGMHLYIKRMEDILTFLDELEDTKICGQKALKEKYNLEKLQLAIRPFKDKTPVFNEFIFYSNLLGGNLISTNHFVFFITICCNIRGKPGASRFKDVNQESLWKNNIF